MKYIFIILFPAVAILSCKKSNDANPYILNTSSQMIGTWYFEDMSIFTYDTALNKFSENDINFPYGEIALRFTTDSTGNYFYSNYPSGNGIPPASNYIPPNGQWSVDPYSQTVYFKCSGNACLIAPSTLWSISYFNSNDSTSGAMTLNGPALTSGGKLVMIRIDLNQH